MEPAAPGLIYKKMIDVMRDIKSVSKDQKNVAQGFKFRGIDQFINALYPALTKHGVFIAPKCTYEAHELKEVTRSSGKVGIDKHVTLGMCYTFYAEDGSNVVVGPIPAEGLDSGDKATNKSLSAALKYALIQTFSVPTEDMAEADLETPEIAAPKREIQITAEGVSLKSGGSNATTATVTGTLPITNGAPGSTLVELASQGAVTTTQNRTVSKFRKAAKDAAPSSRPATPAEVDEWGSNA